ncbi:MAG: response regulator receiver [Chthoniobacteraceae bacterium]|nr:response regulator receiver [Chthoniobacteraceae bacterium]
MNIPSPLEVWLIEDNATFRRTIARVIESNFRCPEGFSRCEDAIECLAKTGARPDVILLDVALPGMNGIDGIPLLRQAAPETRIIILTVFEDDDKIFRAICAGAAGYLLKTASPEEIVRAIRDVLDGGAPMNGRIARRLLEMFSRFNRPHKDYHLTIREREILELMVEGRIKKEIASRLTLSVHTVDTHLRNIYAKLEVHTRTGAVAKALKEKLI